MQPLGASTVTTTNSYFLGPQKTEHNRWRKNEFAVYRFGLDEVKRLTILVGVDAITVERTILLKM
jgi:hypothetical protein